MRSADAALLARLSDGELQARVHSVFRRVVNLMDADGELLTLAARAVDDAPNSAVLDLGAFDELRLRPGEPVLAAHGSLWFDESGWRVVFEGARPWRCELPAWPASTDLLRENLRWCGERLAEHGAVSGGGASAFDSAALHLLAQRADALRRSLERRDFDAATREARSVLGLGPGLTPSGDDFLLGLIATLHLAGSPCEGWLDGGARLLAGAAAATNAISLAALRCAAQGRVRHRIATVLRQLLQGGGQPLEAALADVLAIGANSGGDIAAGLRCGLELQLFHESHRP